MKHFCLALFALSLVLSCSQKQGTTVEAQKVEKALHDFFTAISEYNYQGIKDVCTKDYQLLEDGLVWNADSLVNAIKPMEGKVKIVYRLEEIRTKLEGDMAWMSYRNKAVLTSTDGEEKLEWVESAIFEKQNYQWKMALLHSTRVR
jgi:ketosteroid isomerase-like protein